MTEDEAREALTKNVSRETMARLEDYAVTLIKWQKAMNLIASASVTHIWARHFLDSAQVLPLAPPDPGHWLDMGSGAGFPGMVCAIIGAEALPKTRWTFIESDQRKATFLREVARGAKVDVTVLAERVEDVPPQFADVISARAVAPLPRLLDLTHRHLAPRGICLFQKGAAHATEVAEAARHWHMSVDAIPSKTAPSSVILRISELSHA